REDQHAPVERKAERGFGKISSVGSGKHPGEEQRYTPPREQHGGRAAGEGQQNAFGQQQIAAAVFVLAFDFDYAPRIFYRRRAEKEVEARIERGVDANTEA